MYGTSNGSYIQGQGAQIVLMGDLNGATIAAHGYQSIISGGTVTDTTLYGDQHIYSGGTAVRTEVKAGAKQFIASAPQPQHAGRWLRRSVPRRQCY